MRLANSTRDPAQTLNGPTSRPPPPDSSDELLWSFRHGSLAAFSRLVRQWQPRLYRIAHRITDDGAGSEDVLQSVFLRLFENRDRIRDFDRLGA